MRDGCGCLPAAGLLLVPAASLAKGEKASEVRVLLRRLYLTNRADLTLSGRYLARSESGTELLLSDFFDFERGGFYPYSEHGEQLITRSKESYDGAMPSGNAVAALVLSRLARLTGEARFRTAKELQLRYLAGVITDYPAGHCFSLLAMLEELWPTAELVCAAQELPAELPAFLRRVPWTNLTVLVKTPENEQLLAEIAPFTAAFPIPVTGARYYLCRDGACQAPADSLDALERQMEV